MRLVLLVSRFVTIYRWRHSASRPCPSRPMITFRYKRTGKVLARVQGMSLAGLDLSGLDLSGQNLAGVDFSHCRFEGADLSRADLRGARFYGADLSKAVMFGHQVDDATLDSLNTPAPRPAHRVVRKAPRRQQILVPLRPRL